MRGVLGADARLFWHVTSAKVALAACAGVLISCPALAQTVPDAGSLQRELREGLPGLPARRLPIPRPAAPLQADTGERTLVQRFVVEGARLIPTAELEAALKDLEGRELGLADMQAAAGRIADLYLARGFFARAVLPPQDITSGTVRIRVVEGRFGQLVVRDEAPRADGDYVARVVGARLAQGRAYTAKGLERGLLLANDLPGVRAEATLKAGKEPGTSDLELVELSV